MLFLGLKFVLALSSVCLTLATLDNGVNFRIATDHTVAGRMGRMNTLVLKV
jgi:hypothetical protein